MCSRDVNVRWTLVGSKGQSTTSNLSAGRGLLLRVLGRLVDRSSLNRFLNTLDMCGNRIVMRARPFDIYLETTTKCNLTCIMCSRQKYYGPGKHMEGPILERVQAEIVPYAQNLCISSFGEPLLYPDIGRLLEVARRFPRLELGMFTNLLLVDEDWARKLVDSRVAYLKVSIDGATRETYEKIRRGGKWDRLIQALETLNRVKRERRSRYPILDLAVVGLTANVHEIPLFVEFAKRYEFASLKVDANVWIDDEEMDYLSLTHAKRKTNAMFRAGYARAIELGIHSNLYKVPFDIAEQESMKEFENERRRRQRNWAEKLRRFVRYFRPTAYRLHKIYSAAGKSLLLFPAMLVIILYDHFLRGYIFPARRYLHPTPYEAPLSRCGIPWTHTYIRLDGKVNPCCYSSVVMGDLTTQSFEEIWNGSLYRSLRLSIVTGNFWKSCERAKCNWLEPGASEQYGARIEGVPEAMELLDGLESRLLVKVTNTGRVAWPAAREGDEGASEREFSLAYRLFQLDSRGRLQPFQEGPHVGLLHAVSPAESIEMELPICPIETPGEYMMKVDMVKEHVTWFGERGDSAVKISVWVKALRRGELRVHGLPERIRTVSEVAVEVVLTNTSETVWPAAGPYPVRLTYHWLTEQGEMAVHDGLRTSLGNDLAPGDSAALKARVLAPASPGVYRLQWDLVQEDVSWFGMDWPQTQVEVTRRT